MTGERHKSIKVLHIITRLIKGGAQENTLLTVVNLDKARYQIALLSGPTVGSEGEIESRARQLGTDLIILLELVREISPINDLKALYKTYRSIKNGKYDIVHTHSSKAGVIGRVAGRLAGVKNIVHTPHGSIFDQDADIPSVSGALLIKCLLLVERIAARLTDRIVTLTDAEAIGYVKLGMGDKAKFTTIHSGIDLSRFGDVKIDVVSKKKELGIPSNSTVITTIARLTPEKGHKYLIEAAKEVIAESDNHIKFVFVGDGDLRDDLENKARELGLDEAILFLGLRDDVPEILAISDLFVLSSLYEAQGRVIVEAMAAELPVVATRVGGVPDVVIDGETGILVPPASPQALASAIVKMLADKGNAKQMGQAGKRQVDPEFSVETMVKQIDMLYSELLKRQ